MKSTLTQIMLLSLRHDRFCINQPNLVVLSISNVFDCAMVHSFKGLLTDMAELKMSPSFVLVVQRQLPSVT
ncbi:hypothetical protein LIA77_08999 [Sarocladium implicatum]|nr:hypothetical protein LIA77_08999 [Sarocladium implicatum]